MISFFSSFRKTTPPPSFPHNNPQYTSRQTTLPAICIPHGPTQHYDNNKREAKISVCACLPGQLDCLFHLNSIPIDLLSPVSRRLAKVGSGFNGLSCQLDQAWELMNCSGGPIQSKRIVCSFRYKKKQHSS